MSEFSANFQLKNKWVLWYHKMNDEQWGIDSYKKVIEIEDYHTLLLMVSEIKVVTSGMFFFMKDGIQPIYEDPMNKEGGYWSLRVTKKDANDYWLKIIYLLCFENITQDENKNKLMNGLSISPKINNCIFKIWNSNFKAMKKEDLRKDVDIFHMDEMFYLEHKE